MPRLNKRFVESAVPNAGKTETVFFDDKLTGFGLRVKANGKKSYLIQYRNAVGDSRRQTLGDAAKLTPEIARSEALKELADVERGVDPVERRKELRARGVTVAELCERYLAAAGNGLIFGKRKRPKKASTLETDRGRIVRHIIPLLGKRIVRDVTRADINKFVQDVTVGKTTADVRTKKRGRAIVRGGAGTAARTVGLLGGIFAFAIDDGLRVDNPVHGVPRAADKQRTRRLTMDEYELLGDVLREAENDGENSLAIAAIKLLVFTGARRGEIVALMKSEVDRERRTLRLRDSKEGASIRPLSSAATRAIDSIPPALRQPASKWVFPRADGKRPYSGLPKAIERIMARRPELSDVTSHVFRHSIASLADDLGYTEATTGAIIGHATGSKRSVTARYIHKLDTALIAAADGVTEIIEKAMLLNASEPDSGGSKEMESHDLASSLT